MVSRLTAAIMVAGLVLGCNSAPVRSEAGGGEHAVTPVHGPSWLKHLGLRVSQTRLGFMGGEEPVPSSPRREPKLTPTTAQMMNEPFVLAGADLYRLNCQSCHGPDGKRAPPEIKSLIEPVQGMSTALIKKRMEARGTPIDDALARQLAAESEASLRKRLQSGGEKMPPFRHLQGEEVEALIDICSSSLGSPRLRT